MAADFATAPSLTNYQDSDLLVLRTPSRLHMGLLAPFTLAGGRRFGGLGLMIREPGVTIVGQRADAFGLITPPASPLRPRLQALLEQAQATPILADHPICLQLSHTPPWHVGLGTGTQLQLASAFLLHHLAAVQIELPCLAEFTGRGRRSAIGVHGFAHGGFLVDGGKGPDTTLAPLLVRQPFPEDWPIVLIHLEGPPGIHGQQEESIFKQPVSARPTAPPDAGIVLPQEEDYHEITARQCSLILRELLPSLVERNYHAFADALGEYNRLAGYPFRTWQSAGDYSHPAAPTILKSLHELDIPAAGQTSWGPTLFAILPNRDQYAEVVTILTSRHQLPPEQLTLTQADNRGAMLSQGNQSIPVATLLTH